MKKLCSVGTAVILCILLAAGLTGCASGGQAAYPEYAEAENTALGCIELSYNGNTYRPYGVFTDNKLKGEQIGIREGLPDSKIYAVKGYDSGEWIVEYLDIIMGGNMLFKSVSVTDVPDELEAVRQYDY